MTKYILKWNKEYLKNGKELIPMYAMQNPFLVTDAPEKAVRFESEDEARKFAEENDLKHFKIIFWDFSPEKLQIERDVLNCTKEIKKVLEKYNCTLTSNDTISVKSNLETE